MSGEKGNLGGMSNFDGFTTAAAGLGNGAPPDVISSI
jgi:hypothetical protein